MKNILIQYGIKQFDCIEFGSGHINDTYKITTPNKKYILQRINHLIFKNPEQLMSNVKLICDYLNADGFNDKSLVLIPTSSGDSYFFDGNNYWRLFNYIENTFTYPVIENPQQLFLTGYEFGKFQRRLRDFPVNELYESIPNFHHTPTRFKTLLKAIEENKSNRKHLVLQEIEFILNRSKEISYLTDLISKKIIPLVVTHNDTKLSNILIDKDSKKPVCVVDLDTIMPGIIAYDFGDGIRSGAVYFEEDEQKVSLVSLDLRLYDHFLKGFLEGMDFQLSVEEFDSLIWGAKIITLEQGIRFLTDFLDGDTYYKTKYDLHNLHRCRTQLKIVEDMEYKWSDIEAIFDQYRNHFK